jgi:hypothetical protein
MHDKEEAHKENHHLVCVYSDGGITLFTDPTAFACCYCSLLQHHYFQVLLLLLVIYLLINIIIIIIIDFKQHMAPM